MADKKITVLIAARDMASSVLRRVGAQAQTVGGRLRAHMAGAFAAIRLAALGATAAAAGFIKKIIDVGAETETARIRLDSIFGSVEAGAVAFDAVRTAAAKLPFTFSDTLEAASVMGVAVRRTGGDLEKRLLQLAEISARFGIGIREAGAQFQRLALSGAASADLFRERGVNAFLGIQAGAQVTAEESLRLWDEAFERIEAEGSSAVARLADTWVGQVSMLQDALRELAQAISDTGLLEFAKNIVTEMTRGVRLFADAVKTDLGDAVAAAFGYLGARAGMAFLEGVRSVQREAIGLLGRIPELAPFVDKLQQVFGGFAIDKAIDAASTATQYWTGRLNELALAAKEAADEAARLTSGGTTTTTGTGRGIRAPLPRGGLQPTIGGPGIPVLEAIQSGTLPTRIETRHEWRPILDLDTEAVRRETLSPLQVAFDDVFDDFGKYVGELAIGVGEDLVNGIISGTLEFKDILKRFLIGFAARFILGPLSGALGIFSPSKVTFGFGQQLAVGLIGGMDSMSAPLMAATDRMASTVTSGLRVPRVSGLSGVVGNSPQLTAKIATDDTSAYPPWALDWLARANIELRFAGEAA